ncbi:hypothetical protein ANCCAN_02483 [Ancylostoma caninum]|uniref:Uncharacterized protein n=1 Tax=Ancylostoma caninum TaxID=29170 RepID=A0A368H7L6_ANCCA|nr:hypothetical protein ANCCAN_02483 [Ancylostoma caninum]
MLFSNFGILTAEAHHSHVCFTSKYPDSFSGALDNATKQLDQVIDQARHKHSQHRNKFKEAIDYLDQIFEDLKKEVDPGVEDKIKDRSVAAAAPQHSTVTSPPDNIRWGLCADLLVSLPGTFVECSATAAPLFILFKSQRTRKFVEFEVQKMKESCKFTLKDLLEYYTTSFFSCNPSTDFQISFLYLL